MVYRIQYPFTKVSKKKLISVSLSTSFVISKCVIDQVMRNQVVDNFFHYFTLSMELMIVCEKGF